MRVVLKKKMSRSALILSRDELEKIKNYRY
jgi:hypothetical protein